MPPDQSRCGAMADEVTLARAFGANDYWTKPLDFATSLTQVTRLLAAPPGA